MRESSTAALPKHLLTADEIDQYHRDGFVFKRGLVADLIPQISDTVMGDTAIPSYTREDAEGLSSRLSILNRSGVNVYGAVTRSARILDNAEMLLGGISHSLKGAPEEAYLYHTKVIVKEPRVGGAWEWH